ncbi:hypothetical protein BC834DRAFT_880260 [Gloeopeniophorella convolvens]|nr:hypothetical protein BC834DRAFT_880260 [Gloeopeniophorella convolvens]
MADSDSSNAPVEESRHPEDGDFLANILTPGSSLNPAFLLVVDGVLALLALTFVALAVATRGNIHAVALLLITLGLWASIKWFVNELQNAPPPPSSTDPEPKKTI